MYLNKEILLCFFPSQSFEWGFRVCTGFSGYVVVCPFLSGPDVLVLPEKDEAVLQKDAGPFKKGPDVFYRCRNPLPFPFFPISLPIYAPARPRVNIIMCVHFPSSGVRLKNMSYNISLYQPVTNKFQKSSGKTVRYVWLLS